jgi:hypothetical protein
MRTLLLAAAAASILSGAAQAAPVKLDASPDAPARKVVAAVFRDYLAGKVGVEVQTAAVDIDADGVAEVAARFVHTETCRKPASSCRTVVLRHDGSNWGIVLDRSADKLDLGDGRMLVDGAEWTWNGRAYAPSVEGMGQQVAFVPVPAETVPSISVAFGQGAVKLASAGRAKFEYATPRIADGADSLVVRMTGGASCGMTAGCPVRVLRKEGTSWKTVLTAGTTGGVAVAKTVRTGGVRDVAVQTDAGYVVMGWTGSAYAVADTVEATR